MATCAKCVDLGAGEDAPGGIVGAVDHDELAARGDVTFEQFRA